MSKLFTISSGRYMRHYSRGGAFIEYPFVTSAPFTVSCWFRIDNGSTNQCIWYNGDKDQANAHLWGVMAQSTGKLRFYFADGSLASIDTTTSYTVGDWHHACIVEAASNDHRVFLDGDGKATSSTSKSPLNSDRGQIGLAGDATPSNQMDGALGQLAIWDAALTDSLVRTLASGVNPMSIPDDLLCYYPLAGAENAVYDELNIIQNNRRMSPVNGEVNDEEPPKCWSPIMLR